MKTRGRTRAAGFRFRAVPSEREPQKYNHHHQHNNNNKGESSRDMV